MRKLFLGLVTVLFWGPVSALPLGNPSEASQYVNGVFFDCNSSDNNCDLSWCSCLDAISLRVGYYGDFVYNRNLKVRGMGAAGRGRHIQETQIRTNAGYLALNICDRFDIFGTIGASNLWIKTNEIAWIRGGELIGLLETNTDFSWSVGARGTIFEWCGFDFGLEGQYFQTCLDFVRFTSGNLQRVQEFGSNNEAKYFEWQIGGGVAYEFYVCDPCYLSMIPYIGVKYARARFDTGNFTFVQSSSTDTFIIFNMESSKDWGYAVGLSFTMCGTIGVTVEGRFADETALYVNGQFRF